MSREDLSAEAIVLRESGRAEVDVMRVGMNETVKSIVHPRECLEDVDMVQILEDR